MQSQEYEGGKDDASMQNEEDTSLNIEHCILTLQFSSNEETRTYLDFKSQEKLSEAYLRIYEKFLLGKKQLADKQKDGEEGDKASDEIEYTLEDVCQYVDQMFDCGVMVYNNKANGYTAHGKPWLKATVHAHLRKQTA